MKFLEKAEKLFNQYELYRNAGDAFVHIAYKAAQLEVSEKLHEIYDDGHVHQREVMLLRKAEEYYSKCKKIEEKISGYYKLISVYFRMDMWNEVAVCYMLVLNACINSSEAQEVIDILREIKMLNDKFIFNDLEKLISKVEDIEKAFESEEREITNRMKYALTLQIAKLFSYLSEKTNEKEIQSKYLDKSMKKYDKIITKSNEPELIEISYNDSALILQSVNRMAEAKERLEKSIQMASDKFSEACSRANFARFLIKEGDNVGAKREFEKSIGALVGRNNYWNQRKEDQDISPLTSMEIPELRFEKKWCASVAVDYGIFLYNSDHQKATALLSLAKKIFIEVKEENKAQEIARLETLLDKTPLKKTSQNFQAISAVRLENDIMYDTSFSLEKHVKCGACGYSYDSIRNTCPYCGVKTCSNCGQPTYTQNEICEHCKHWID